MNVDFYVKGIIRERVEGVKERVVKAHDSRITCARRALKYFDSENSSLLMGQI